MQNENLETMGVQEMNASEMKEENGGWLWIAICAGVYLYNNWDDFEAGYAKGRGM